MKIIMFVFVCAMALAVTSVEVDANDCYDECINENLFGEEKSRTGSQVCRGIFRHRWYCPREVTRWLAACGCKTPGDIVVEGGERCVSKAIPTATYTVTCGFSSPWCDTHAQSDIPDWVEDKVCQKCD